MFNWWNVKEIEQFNPNATIVFGNAIGLSIVHEHLLISL